MFVGLEHDVGHSPPFKPIPRFVAELCCKNHTFRSAVPCTATMFPWVVQVRDGCFPHLKLRIPLVRQRSTLLWSRHLSGSDTAPAVKGAQRDRSPARPQASRARTFPWTAGGLGGATLFVGGGPFACRASPPAAEAAAPDVLHYHAYAAKSAPEERLLRHATPRSQSLYRAAWQPSPCRSPLEPSWVFGSIGPHNL